jgi:hypothetical protein
MPFGPAQLKELEPYTANSRNIGVLHVGHADDADWYG